VNARPPLGCCRVEAVDSAGTPLVAARTPRGIRKRVAADGSIRWQVRYLVRDAASPSGWVETSSTFGTLRPALPRHGSLSHEAAAKGGWCEAAEADESSLVKTSVVSDGAARQGLGGSDVGGRGRRGRALLPRATLAGCVPASASSQARTPILICGRCSVGGSVTRRHSKWYLMALYGQLRRSFGGSAMSVCRLS